MNVETLAIPGVYRATPRRKAVRSYDWYRTDALSPALPDDWRPAVGTVHTIHRGQVIGLHVESGHRVVTCVTGRLALAVADVRRGSGTFARWIPLNLEPIDHPTVVIPPGTAWGVQGFAEISVLLALHEDGGLGLQLDPTDPSLEISWPLSVSSSGITVETALARGDLPQ